MNAAGRRLAIRIAWVGLTAVMMTASGHFLPRGVNRHIGAHNLDRHCQMGEAAWLGTRCEELAALYGRSYWDIALGGASCISAAVIIAIACVGSVTRGVGSSKK